MKHVIVIGAGIGGLTTAAALARTGMQVTVLEAHTYAGGCAGTFFHQKYLFDAGATLAGGFYPGGPMDLVGQAVGITDWGARPADPAMVVHLPDGHQVARGCETDYRETTADQRFWRWQRSAADQIWELALQSPAWPPQSLSQAMDLFAKSFSWWRDDQLHRLSPGLLKDAVQPVAERLVGVSENLRLLVDGQLLISAQATSENANALYAATALDLPRRGVAHFQGGVGAIANQLVDAIRRHGGSVLFRQPVRRIRMEQNRVAGVETSKGLSLPADAVIANLTPWNIKELLREDAPRRLRNLPAQPVNGWGAFVVYVGIDAHSMPGDALLHHQVISARPLGEGRTVFLSISPEWDTSRAPNGYRAVTISTHTRLGSWWDLYANDSLGYESCKQMYTERVLRLAERVIPNLRERAELILPGTPITFKRFTGREWGWVGGFPQVNLFQAWGPRLTRGLWMVGDSIFPGQSIAAAALGGLRVAEDVHRTAGVYNHGDYALRQRHSA